MKMLGIPLFTGVSGYVCFFQTYIAGNAFIYWVFQRFYVGCMFS